MQTIYKADFTVKVGCIFCIFSFSFVILFHIQLLLCLGYVFKPFYDHFFSVNFFYLYLKNLASILIILSSIIIIFGYFKVFLGTSSKKIRIRLGMMGSIFVSFFLIIGWWILWDWTIFSIFSWGWWIFWIFSSVTPSLFVLCGKYKKIE